MAYNVSAYLKFCEVKRSRIWAEQKIKTIIIFLIHSFLNNFDIVT